MKLPLVGLRAPAHVQRWPAAVQALCVVFVHDGLRHEEEGGVARPALRSGTCSDGNHDEREQCGCEHAASSGNAVEWGAPRERAGKGRTGEEEESNLNQPKTLARFAMGQTGSQSRSTSRHSRTCQYVRTCAQNLGIRKSVLLSFGSQAVCERKRVFVLVSCVCVPVCQ